MKNINLLQVEYHRVSNELDNLEEKYKNNVDMIEIALSVTDENDEELFNYYVEIGKEIEKRINQLEIVKQKLEPIVQEQIDIIEAEEVADTLIGSIILPQNAEYREIAMKAKELGLNYIGKKREILLEEVNIKLASI